MAGTATYSCLAHIVPKSHADVLDGHAGAFVAVMAETTGVEGLLSEVAGLFGHDFHVVEIEDVHVVDKTARSQDSEHRWLLAQVAPGRPVYGTLHAYSSSGTGD